MDRRRMLTIFGIAWVSAMALTWFLWSLARGQKKERFVQVVAAARDMASGTRLRKADLKTLTVPERELPKGVLTRVADAEGRVLLYPVTASEVVNATRLTSWSGAEGIPATIEPGKRAIAVPITDASGVAGLVQPRSRVDVLFTRTGAMAEAATVTILQDIEVLSVGRITQAGQTVDPRAPRVPVATLLVTPEEARKLELAKNQGKISLALRNPLDRSTAADNAPVTAEALDPLVHARAARARRGLPPLAGAKLPDVRDESAWRELTGQKPPPPKPEPPKPKHVVDVFRGDKHVQEIFQ
ncbi:MAG: Flp pilus assembly protein CpaB [Acidobacteria bacterium]|nr:Flp pilus assembly protein CpaB [Acidobacteriota bacterium]